MIPGLGLADRHHTRAQAPSTKQLGRFHRKAFMETTREFVGPQRARGDLTGWRVGQLSWVGRVAALCVGMVGMVTAVASPTAAAQATSSTDRARGAVNATDERVSQAHVVEAV